MLLICLTGLEKTIQECDLKPAVAKLLKARQVNAAPSMASFPGNLAMQMPRARTPENLGFC